MSRPNRKVRLLRPIKGFLDSIPTIVFLFTTLSLDDLMTLHYTYPAIVIPLIEVLSAGFLFHHSGCGVWI